MVIGNGLIAREFANYKESESVLIFASGVSDSTESRKEAFDRERSLVNATLADYPEMLFVYFSTYSIDDERLKDRPYTQHKLTIEQIIQEKSSNYLICRLSNIVGFGGNSSNVFNFIVNSIQNELPIDVWKNATRSILSIADMKSILERVIEAKEINKIITIANPNSYKLPDLVQRIEAHFGKSFKGNYLNKGGDSTVNVDSIAKHIEVMKTDFSINYIDHILTTYYPCQ